MKLKTFSITLAVIMVVAFALGVMFIAIGGDYNFGDNVQITGFPINQMGNSSIDGINKIVISGDSAEINVLFEDEEELLAQLSGYIRTDSDSIPELIVANEGDVLRIRMERKNFFTIFNEENLTLNVHVPKDYNNKMKISTASGNVLVEESLLSELECDTASGNIRIEGLKNTDFNANTASGELIVANSELKTLEVNTASGNVDFSGAVLGDTDINSASGDINLNLLELSGNVEVDSASGNVNIALPENAGFMLEYDTASGELENPFPMTIKKMDSNTFSGTSGDAEHEIEVDTSSGDLMIEVNE